MTTIPCHANYHNEPDDLFISTKVYKLYTRSRFAASLQSFQEVARVKLEQDKFGTCLVRGHLGPA